MRFQFITALPGHVAAKDWRHAVTRIGPVGCFLLVSALLVSGAMAAEVRVGRATVETDAGWHAYEVDKLGIDYGGDHTGTIRSETKAFVQVSPDKQLNAIVIVRASFGGIGQGRMVYSPVCKGNAETLAVGNNGFNRTYSECWTVSRALDAQAVLKLTKSVELPGLGQVGVPETVVLITSSYANDSGNFLEVVVVLGPTLLGREGPFDTALPAGVETRFALVGQDFAKAVRAYMNSLSGRFVFPPVTFSK